MIFYDVHRSLTEYVNSHLATQTGEVTRFEFPTTELGSHTYSVHLVNYLPEQVGGRNLTGTAKGRIINSLVQVDVFRMPTAGQPDMAGALKMASRVSDMFKGTHYIPLNSYGATPAASTTGTVSGAIQVDETEDIRESFDPDPNIRRLTQSFKLRVNETF